MIPLFDKKLKLIWNAERSEPIKCRKRRN